jgi:hypothetical protein
MPRFSDIFVYAHTTGDVNMLLFKECYMLKAVGEHAAGSKVGLIQFDVAGMVLFFKTRDELSGPFPLTTASPAIPSTPVDA